MSKEHESQLLKNKTIRHALMLLGIENPENHEDYLYIYEAYHSLRHMLIGIHDIEKDPLGVFVDAIVLHCKYEIEGSPRRIVFKISKEAHISQMFLYLVFMKSGHMNNSNNIVLSNYTPIYLIKFANMLITRLG